MGPQSETSMMDFAKRSVLVIVIALLGVFAFIAAVLTWSAPVYIASKPFM